MKRKLFVVLSAILMASMILSACSSATPTVAPDVTEPTAAATEATGGEEVQEPAEPTATTAAETEPTEEVAEPTEAAPQSDRKGGWLDKIIFSAVPEVDPAIAQLEAGAIDIYAVSSEDASSFEKVKSSDTLQYANVYGSSNQMILNTVECTDTTIFNPFSIAEIREAMNWAIDRNYVSQEIMGGLAKPKFTALSSAFADYSRYADVMGAIETKYAYNLDKAKEAVTAAMEDAGATLNADGKWEKDGKIVTIIALIRTEDKRKEIGNYFANQMEELGFTVDRQEKDRTEAGPIWQGDPKECKFSFYTAGWISTAISRDEGNMFAQYNTGQIQSIPLFNEYQPSPELKEVGDKLWTNQFTTMEERAEMFQTALDLSMSESWWGIWVTDNISFSPYSTEVEAAYDLAGGFASAQLWPYTIRRTGEEGGEIKIAQSGILVQPWNPVAGSNWTDDSMIQRGTMDWGVVFDPYTGLVLPKLVEKAEVVAKEGLPLTNTSDWVDVSFESEITVPEDAWVDWDAVNQKFITVGEKYPEGITANTKSTVHYIPELWETTWHDGSKLSIGDFIMGMILTFDTGKPESKIYDPATAPALETLLTHFKGVKILSTDPLVIETYDDTYALDGGNTIVATYNWSWYPSYTYGPGAWHNLTPAIMAEEAGELAFTTDKAQEKEIEWTSLIAGPSLETQVKYLDQALAEKYLPYAATMSEFVTEEEATTRFENLKAWYDAKKHLFIGTGPYFVDQVFPVEGTVTLARYEEYMFPASTWSIYAAPKIATATIEGDTQITAGEEATFDVYVTTEDEPYLNADIEQVSYVLYNANNEAVASGQAEAVEDGLYQVVLSAEDTGKLESGASKLSVAVSSKVVSLPAFTTYEFVVSK